MAKILWSEVAAQQLLQVTSPERRREILHAAGGLSLFPQKGRIPPEVQQAPESLIFPPSLRELIFPGLARLLYLYDETTDTVRILGLLFKGQPFDQARLGEILPSKD